MKLKVLMDEIEQFMMGNGMCGCLDGLDNRFLNKLICWFGKECNPLIKITKWSICSVTKSPLSG